MKKEIFYDLAAEIEKECGDWEQSEGLSEKCKSELLAKVAELEQEQTTKVKRFPLKKRYILVLAATLILAMGLGATGDRAWISDKEDLDRAGELTTKIDTDEKEDILLEEEMVYQEISETLGIADIRLGYIPNGMELHSYAITENTGWAYVNYLYEGEVITVQMTKGHKEVSGSVQWDGEYQDAEKITNMYGHEIEVYCVDAEQKKYNAKLLYGNGYYEIFGRFLDKNEFFSILEQIFFKNV